MKWSFSHSVHVWLFATQWTVACQAPLSMDFPGRNTGVGCHFLLQGIFLTQGLNLGLQHYRQTLHHLSRQGSPMIQDSDLVSFFCMWPASFTNTVYWTDSPFLTVCSSLLCHRLIIHICMSWFLGSQFCFCWSLCLFLYQYHIFFFNLKI